MINEKRIRALRAFCEGLGVAVKDLSLLDMALTHTSYAHELKGAVRAEHSERVEFLGDSVLSLVVSTYMYRKFPDLTEGQLTKLRAHLVCEASLCDCAKKMKLGDLLLLGRGEELSGGRERPSILADAFEAVLGAIYLDRGLAAAEKYLLDLMQKEIDHVCRTGIGSDHKTRLQEYLQRGGDADISYRLVDSSGPEHRKIFSCEVALAGKVLGRGSGKSKKEAEQQAAKVALQSLGLED